MLAQWLLNINKKHTVISQEAKAIGSGCITNSIHKSVVKLNSRGPIGFSLTLHSTKCLIGHFLPLYFFTKTNSCPYPTCYRSTYVIFEIPVHQIIQRHFTPNLQKSSFLSKNIMKVNFDSRLEEYIFCRQYWCKGRKLLEFAIPSKGLFCRLKVQTFQFALNYLPWICN